MTIRIESTPPDARAPYVLVSAPGKAAFDTVFTDTTDDNGRVSADVAFGQYAGVGRIRAAAASLGLSDSTTYTVLPGKIVNLSLAPTDTALYVGASVRLRLQAFDRLGNSGAGLARWSVASGPVTTSDSGVVSGLDLGRAFVRIDIGTATDSVGVSVVPPGVIAAIYQPIAYGSDETLVVFNTDGSNLRRIDLGGKCGHGLQWFPGRDALILGRDPPPGLCFAPRLYTITLNGTAARVRPDTTPLAAELFPRVTADNQWIYFTGQPGSQNGEIWRVRQDGSGSERIGPAAGHDDLDQQPWPSPNATQVIYSSRRNWITTLRILDVTSGAVSDLGVSGLVPAWSPTGDKIAFLQGDQYYVMDRSGMGLRSLVQARYSAGLPDTPAWSPDGRWLVLVAPDANAYAPLYGKLVLVQVSQGTVLPLGWTAQLTYPTWRSPDQ